MLSGVASFLFVPMICQALTKFLTLCLARAEYLELKDTSQGKAFPRGYGKTG
jgi:hypothetical protein